MKKQKVMFFHNGCTAFFTGNEQTPELQEPWILLYVKFLESKGIDPTLVEFELPGEGKVRVFQTDNGWNWERL